MSSLPSFRGSVASARAFTLIELLVVVGIMGILMALSLPMLSSLSDGSNLTTAGQMLADQVKLAAQTAASRGQIVEVRLLKVSLPATAAARYRAIQLWTANAAGTLVPAERMAVLPSNIVINETPQLSPLLSLNHIGTGTMADGLAKGASYVAFKVHPAGYFDPEPAAADRKNLYVTLLVERLATVSAAPPNYFAVQISPYTCAPALYRP